MPNFLLCNSKLTFQMTMTPEKTNYFTQGADGAKRLKQGPDLPSYRGLSIIHSRSFAMEAGQHPRDILRRRVRTAEYYRILPSSKNKDYEFEFYNEERDTWFSMTFQDLLRCAQHETTHENDGYGTDNPTQVNRVYNLSTKALGGADGEGFAQLGAGMTLPETAMIAQATTYLGHCKHPLVWLNGSVNPRVECEIKGGGNRWQLHQTPFDMGITHIPPKADQHPVWAEWVNVIQNNRANLNELGIELEDMTWSMNPAIRLTTKMRADLFEMLEEIPLTHPFKRKLAEPRTPDWFSAFTYYQEVYKRFGYPMEYLKQFAINPRRGGITSALTTHADIRLKAARNKAMWRKADISHMLLSVDGLQGAVNHIFNMESNLFSANTTAFQQDKTEFFARSFLMTYELLHPLLREYVIRGVPTTTLDLLMDTSPNDRMMADFAEIITILVAQATAARGIVQTTVMVTHALTDIIKNITSGLPERDEQASGGFYLGKNGINTWPMTYSSHSHPLHQRNGRENTTGLDLSFGHMNLAFLNDSGLIIHDIPAMDLETIINLTPLEADTRTQWKKFWGYIKNRMFGDPVHNRPCFAPTPVLQTEEIQAISRMPPIVSEVEYLTEMQAVISRRQESDTVTRISPASLAACRINLNDIFLPETQTATAVRPKRDDSLDNVEIVIIRPNIEHNMLGIIMGEGGSELGSTLWGQTELSCYDDSMHGLWGMSYKYHERAIVFNEKNLVRLWDIAYDGYNGGKDDTFVDWIDPKAKNSHVAFGQHTMDIGKNYRGPSMMVMAFVHNKTARGSDGSTVFDSHFKRNWPSPIVFHDTHNPHRDAAPVNETLPLDYDNIQVVDVDDFRVFNNELYHQPYTHYKERMPPFQELHKMRKTAGHSSAESETQTDSLAFQGSMRIKLNGRVEQEIQGSGHHGADYIGVASVRAGKGLRFNGQAPTLAHMV
jgi:hypothetical protein